ncbi:hypothetical protein IMCC20628_04640 (plasmid) [Hoeflea sp. IMCC20628]|uniref:hypothetical protein n=1 Tax=Hoeflea sp. IMCC20628 TaxID=1620421 RepID=UPI00063AE56F|nr:hypothetical protein [Hoeflea sp. IMCC20628]AKI03306.1 hypothetical protein IMCC20628_04640 [Hoeflea sp. IMCC20628]
MSYVANFPRILLLTAGILAAGPVLADTLTQAQIADQIIGKDLAGQRNGMTVRLRYNADGSVAMKAAFITGAGTWTFAGDGLCMTMTKGPKRGKTCTAFENLGGGAFRNSEGVTLRVGK